MAIRRLHISAPRPPAEYTPDVAARDARRIAESRTLQLLPLDVIGLATSIGIQVDYLPLSEDISGFLKRKDGVWMIGVNSLHHVNRQRFTIAHELGHYFLHRDRGEFVDRALFRKELQFNNLESDANNFAAKLLMPENDFRGMVVRDRVAMSMIAKHFGVSEMAAKYRANSLGEERIFG